MDQSDRANDPLHDSAMTSDTDSPTDQSTEARTTGTELADESTKDHVTTINLRGNAEEIHSSQPSSPSPSMAPAPSVELGDAGADKADGSQDPPDLELAESRTPLPPGDTSPPSTRASSGSPEAELIDLVDDNEILLPQDPTDSFPFYDARSESPYNHLARIVQYVQGCKFIPASADRSGLITRTIALAAGDEGVIMPISQWVEQTVHFFRTVEPERAFGALERHRQFWIALPDLAWCLCVRR